MKRATVRQLIGLTGLCGLAAVAAVLFSVDTVISELEGLASRPLLFCLALGIVYLVRPFLLWPVSSLALALGFLYGAAIAFPLALAGAALSALPPYLIGRYAQTDIGLFGAIGHSGEAFVATVGEFRGVVAARFSPVPGDPISYGAGLTGVSLQPFLSGTVVGEVPWALVTVFTGASMRSLSLSEFAVSPELVVALAGLTVILLAGPLYNYYRGERRTGAPTVSQD
ncbi:TVP38/TMEM64 family protein [Halovenus rubra]|uniref:TVP38/TMEM64 family protein n=2 Tax=Halovenus rubra TaxID=869890 RepID=A0ABD5X094_9EURY|nr:VTT domain-containing protein [Halovenus rubra]